MKSSITFKTNPNALKKAINNAVKQSTFSFTCPNCNSSFEFKGTSIGGSVNCPFCHITININNDEFNNDINKLQKDFDKIFK